MSTTIESRGGLRSTHDLSSQRLAIRAGYGFNLTQKGRLAHELVAVSEILYNHSAPEVAFSMSDDMYQGLSLRQQELLRILGLQQNEPAKNRRISSYKTRLEEAGYPYWRRLDDGK